MRGSLKRVALAVGITVMMVLPQVAGGPMHSVKASSNITVVGFDNVALARATNPPLTTISGFSVRHGFLAARLLLDVLQGSRNLPLGRQITLRTRLVVRDSTGPPPRQTCAPLCRGQSL